MHGGADPSGREASSRRAAAVDVAVTLAPETAGRAAAAADLDVEWLRDHLERALELLTHPVTRVSVRVVGDAEMRRLHGEHLGLDETTDVLTFPASGAGEPIDVDVAVCLDLARREAEARGHRASHELLLYALHGVLHCAGFDDGDDAASRVMHEEEDRILRAVGVGPTYASPKGAAPAVPPVGPPGEPGRGGEQ